MHRLLFGFALLLLLASCSYDWPPPYVDFEEATAHITEKYGEPAVIRATAFYEEGESYKDIPDSTSLVEQQDSIRRLVVYWDIDPPEVKEEWITKTYGPGSEYEYTYLKTTEYITYQIEIWNQPYSDRTTINRYRQYGWEILREHKSTYQYVE